MKRPLLQAEAELSSARAALAGMRRAQDFETFEREWRAFLNAIAKLWVKMERACQHVRPEFEPWQRPFKECRESDPLLAYLRHAKNADQHTIQEVMEIVPGSRTINSVDGGSLYIEKLVLSGGSIVEYRGDKPLLITDTPATARMVSVIDRGAEYPPPSEHLGLPLRSDSPASAAEAALAYYERFVTEAKERFFRQ